MEMIAVIGVVIRAQHGGEAAAGAGVDRRRNSLLLRAAVPPGATVMRRPSAKDEAAHVNRLGAGMGRTAAAARDIAAGIAAHGLDAGQPRAQRCRAARSTPNRAQAAKAVLTGQVHRADIAHSQCAAIPRQRGQLDRAKVAEPFAQIAIGQGR